MSQIFKVGNRSFEIIVASDVDRDGLGWELWEHLPNDRVFRSEIFRRDDTKTIEYWATEHTITFEALERLIKDFNSTGGKDLVVIKK